MKVKNLMSQHTCTVERETSLTEVARLMVAHDVGAIPVVAEGKPIGIITDRDIVCRSLAKGETPYGHAVKDYMTVLVITVHPDDDLQLCLDLMEQYQLRRMLVVDQEGTLCGMVAQADIAREASSYQKAELLERVSA